VIIFICKIAVVATITLSENNHHQHIDIDANDIVQLQLDEAPTTGYKWEIAELNTNDLQIISEDFILNPNAGVGGAGRKIIQLKALRKASGNLKLEYRRPWSGDSIKSFEFFYS
jgi:inhibitor of cysteine peptidase